MFKAVFVAVSLSFVLLSSSPLPAASTSLDAPRIDKILTAARLAAGGALLDRFATVTVSGTATQGGPPFSFSGVTDLRNGFFRTRSIVGPATFVQGYDGVEWNDQNGVFSIVSLPTYIADAVTQAYLGSNAMFRPEQRSTVVSGEMQTIGGRAAYVLHVEPADGSPADLAFDATTYRLVRVIVQTADGPDTTTNSSFQNVQGVPTSMHSVDVNSSGTTTTTTLTSVRYEQTLDQTALARPAYVSRGELAAPVSIPFVSDVDGAVGHLVVPVKLGAEAASLVFDSGGSNFLTPDAAKRLGLTTSGGVATGGVGAKQQLAGFSAVPSVDFGGARLSHQSFTVTTVPYALAHPRRSVTTEGLIGFEYLANFRVTVDYADGRIDVAPFDSPTPAGGVTLPMKSDGSHAYVEASIDGVTGYFLLDTGNGGGIDLNGPFVETNHLFPADGLTYVSPGGIGGTVSSTVTAAKTLQFAGLTLNDVPVALPHTKSGSFATRGVAGNFGARLLSRFTVVFDYKAQTVTFIPNAAANAKFAADRTGLSLNQTSPQAFEVLAVVPASPASDAGIAANDRITAVNGTQVANGLGLGDMFRYLTGDAPITLTVERGSATKQVTVTPRDILPPPQ